MAVEFQPPQSDLWHWVTRESAEQAGFRQERVLSQTLRGKGFVSRIYSGFIENPQGGPNGLHILAAVKVTQGKKISWYFGKYEAPPWKEMTQEEAERCVRIEQKILNDKNRIQPRMLKTIIQQTIESYRNK